MPTRAAEHEQPEGDERDSREPEPENSNTIGRSSDSATMRSSENVTLNSRTTRDTTENVSDRVEQAMAEARACLRRAIRVLQERAARYEELGDQQVAEAVYREICNMEAMESSMEDCNQCVWQL